MNITTKVVLAALFASVAWGCSQSSDSSTTPPSIQGIAAGFTNYQKITKEMVFVNPDLAASCVGASKASVDSARIAFGPHANTGILVYMNDLAATAFRTNAAIYPVGAVVVKQKTIHGYRGDDGKWTDGGGNGVGGMVKREPGYDPQHGDWEYFYFENAGKIESGRIASCVQCHASAKDKDHVFGTWLDKKH